MATYPVLKRSYKLQFVDHILDNLYGQIGITQVERKLERLPLFKRLHGISQLGLTNWIFPCALHTRYIHSIGVMHNAYNMAIHINQNVPVFFVVDDLIIIRLTGLLHDIGHYPLSHNIEAAYKIGNHMLQRKVDIIGNKKETLTDLTGCPQFLNPIEGASKTNKTIEFNGSQEYHHEAIGQQVITHSKAIHNVVRENFVLFKRGKTKYFNKALLKIGDDCNTVVDDDYVKEATDALLQTIAAIVIGNYEQAFQRLKYKFQRKYTAMLQLIHSEVDADNLDYLLRDATFSGTSYGTMDLGVLLNSLTVKEIEMPPEVLNPTNKSKDAATDSQAPTQELPKFYLVGITPKGVGCIDQFFQNKFLAYSQMIYNKHVSILEAMVLNWACIKLPYDTTYGIPEYQTNPSSLGLMNIVVDENDVKEEFLHFTDSFILQAFNGSYNSQGGGGEDRVEGSEPVQSVIHNEVMLQKEEDQQSQEDSTFLTSIIVSRLRNFVAFNLVDKGKNEMLCVGTEKQIYDKIRSAKLYKDFSKLANSIKGEKILEFLKSKQAMDLFAYRFEEYSMTKQYPKNDLLQKLSENDSILMRTKVYFIRLAEGVPILDQKKKYYIISASTTNREEKIKDEIKNTPDLVVDSSASALQNTYNQKLVYLRKYNIVDYKTEN